ncbi:MAG: hypothetical protein ACQETL_15670 [Bacteroidota bacterium]
MRFLYFSLILLLFGTNGFSTAQVPDYLLYNGDTLALFSNPLKSYLEKNNIEQIPDLKGCNSTNCWRGYIAFWELRNDSLYLQRITSCHDNCGLPTENANLSLLFDNYDGSPIFAYWVKEVLISPQGRLIQYVHMGYGSKYEREIHFDIRNGRLTDFEEIENDFENNEQIERYNYALVRDSIFYHVSKGTDWSIMGGEEFCDDAYFIKIGKSGKVKSVTYEPIDGDNLFQRLWWNLGNRECINSVKRPIKGINFKRMIPNEHFKPMTIRLEIDYDEDKGLTLWK